MYTVCPKCALPLAVTAADLRAGQGYVRCGRCANVFNALLRLSEESTLADFEGSGPSSSPYIEMEKASATVSRPALLEPEPEPGSGQGPEPESASATERKEPLHAAPEASLPEEPFPGEDEEFSDEEFFDPEITNPKIGVAPLDLEAHAPASRAPALRLVDTPPRPPPPDLVTDAPESEAAAVADEDVADEEVEPYRGTGTFETIVLEGDTFLQTEETIPEEVLASEIANVSRRIAEARDTAQFAALMEGRFADNPESELPPDPELAALREATGEFKHTANLGVEADDPATWFRAARSWGDWRLISGAVVLGVLLVLQALNHWRDDLATQAGWFGPMRALSSFLGEPLRPDWDLNAYDVRQLGADADSADNQTLRVRLSLTNVGQRVQALPLIRLTLRDRYGKAVSRGELEPQQYLPQDMRGQLMIRRDQRIDTEVRVLDPTRQASSFELDVCVPATRGGLRCAGDTPALASRAP
jgi:predicted Zn finger-like uncharacterized protein